MICKKIAAAVMAVTIALSAAACGKGDTANDSDTAAAAIEPAAETIGFEADGNDTDEQFDSNAADLSFRLFKSICLDDIERGDNAVISPESVILSLALAANGAGGTTLAEFEKLLGGDGGQKLDDINKNLNALISSARESKDVSFGIADSIWVRDSERITLLPEYAETCKRSLDADSFLAPFDKDTLDKLNGWVKEKTNGMIDGIKEKFTPDELAVLINCIAFEGEWSLPYMQIAINDGSFKNSKGEEQPCTMLASSEDYYLNCDKAEGFVKPYKGGRYGFAALLPNEGVSLKELAGSLDGSSFRAMFESPEYTAYTVNAEMPEFTFDWKDSIAEEVRGLGLEHAFANTDFTRMAKTEEELVISDIIHKTHIEVDRSGTKAAAATEIVMTEGAAIIDEDKFKNITLDRPYLFAIVDLENKLPVFIGAVNSIEN